MGMPITVNVVDATDAAILDAVFAYFEEVDRRFSTYKPDSEIEAINQGGSRRATTATTCAKCWRSPKGRAARRTATSTSARRTARSTPPASSRAGRSATPRRSSPARAPTISSSTPAATSSRRGRTHRGEEWSVGIRNPFNPTEIIKVVYPRGRGVATSGTYVRGQHIYNPHAPENPIADIVSLTVIGPDVLDADRFATAAFAMGTDGIYFIESMPGLEGYIVDSHGRATPTSGFADCCAP